MADKYIDAILRFKDKFTAPMKKAQEKVKAQQKTLNSSTKKIENVGKKFTNAGKALTAGVTAPLVALGTTCVKSAADFEVGMSNVKAISGATGKEMKKLESKALEMGKKTKFSASESADAFKYMAMAGWKTRDMLNGIEGIMYLAGATGEDLASTSDIVTDALTAFGMQAKETNRFVDVLAKTANNANTDVSKMGESFKYVAPVAGALKYSVEDVAVALGTMANSGIKASSAGTSLRALLTNLSKPSKQVKEAMDKLGISLTDSSGKMKPLSGLMVDMRKKFSGLTEAQKAQYAAALAGKTGMSGLLAIVNASDKDFESLTESINDSKGAAEEMYKVANDNLNGALTEMKSMLSSCAITIGNKLSPYIKKAAGYIKDLGEWFNNLSDEQLNTIMKIAGVAAAIGPLLLIIGKVIKTVARVRKTVKTVTTAMSALSPKTIIITAVILALAAAAILVYKNWDKIKPVLIKVGEWFKNTAQKINEQIKKLKNGFKSLKERIKEDISAAKIKIGEFVEKIKNSTGTIGAHIHNIRNIFGGIKTTLRGIITFITGVFTGNWSKAWEGVVNIFKGIFSTLGSILKVPLNGVIGLINGAINQINKIHVTIPEWVPGVGGKSFGGNIPTIPFLAKGTEHFKGGKAVINEKGGEIVDLPTGTRVIPHDKSVKEAYKTGAKTASRTVVINKIADNVYVREESDIDKIADKIAQKLEQTEKNIA